MIFYARNINKELVFSNKKELLDFLASENYKGLYSVEIKKTTRVRTDTQNRALHLFFEHLAQELNNAGYCVQVVLKEKIDLDWDSDKVKELLWRPAQIAITKKKSTTKLDKTSDINKIYEHLNRHIGQKFGLHVPFPVLEKKPENDPYKDLVLPEGEVKF